MTACTVCLGLRWIVHTQPINTRGIGYIHESLLVWIIPTTYQSRAIKSQVYIIFVNHHVILILTFIIFIVLHCMIVCASSLPH